MPTGIFKLLSDTVAYNAKQTAVCYENNYVITQFSRLLYYQLWKLLVQNRWQDKSMTENKIYRKLHEVVN